MTGIERDGSGFVVAAALLAEAFGMSEAAVRAAMRDGTLTSRCEEGTGSDAGRWRLTFRHAGRTHRFTVDGEGTILSRAAFPAPARPRGD